MKVYILVDENKIIRCLASEESNLHEDKLYMDKYYVERKGRTGDEYDSDTDTWTPQPDNYPQPKQEEIDKQKIQVEMKALAIKSLKDKGELPPDYKTGG